MMTRGIGEIRITPWLEGDNAAVGIEAYDFAKVRLLKVEGPPRIALLALANLLEAEAIRL